MTGQRVTTNQAAELLGVPPDTIGMWKYRKTITPVGLLKGQARGGQVPVYLLEELQPLAERYHNECKKRGRTCPRCATRAPQFSEKPTS